MILTHANSCNCCMHQVSEINIAHKLPRCTYELLQG
nr:MAG TPA: hypothetical protein [Caudoviricetes sp.]